MFSLIGGFWTIRTRALRERSIRHWGWGVRGGTVGVDRDNIGRQARYRPSGNRGSKPPGYVCTYATIFHELHMYLRT